MNHTKNVYILDGSPSSLTDGTDAPVIIWKSSHASPNPIDSIVLSDVIEKEADSLRESFLLWMSDLEALTSHHMKLSTHFSYWHNSLMFEKCNFFKSLLMEDAIRALALDRTLKSLNFNQLVLFSGNLSLTAFVTDWCRKHEKSLEILSSKDVDRIPLMSRLKSYFPRWFLFWFWLLIYSCKRWPFKNEGVDAWKNSLGQCLLISYSDNLNKEAMESGDYQSAYWGGLPELLKRRGHAINVLHIFVEDKHYKNAKSFRQGLRKLNAKEKGAQVHVVLDSFLNFNVLKKVYRDAKKIKLAFHHLDWETLCQGIGEVNLRPFLKSDVEQSASGTALAYHLITFHLFEMAMAQIPRQQLGLYLQENQGWERACVSAWRQNKHHQIFGVQHSSVRYWDLRCFLDQQSSAEIANSLSYQPNGILVNGPVAKHSLLKSGLPIKYLFEVEALRYQHFSDITIQKISTPKAMNILIVGEYVEQDSRDLLDLWGKIDKNLLVGQVWFKPHPNCEMEVPASTIPLTKTDLALSEALTHVQIVITGNLSTAAVEAWLHHKHVISLKPKNKLNLSPLDGLGGVTFISSPSELKTALSEISFEQDDHARSFFYGDPLLSRWQSFIQTALEQPVAS